MSADAVCQQDQFTFAFRKWIKDEGLLLWLRRGAEACRGSPAFSRVTFYKGRCDVLEQVTRSNSHLVKWISTLNSVHDQVKEKWSEYICFIQSVYKSYPLLENCRETLQRVSLSGLKWVFPKHITADGLWSSHHTVHYCTDIKRSLMYFYSFITTTHFW